MEHRTLIEKWLAVFGNADGRRYAAKQARDVAKRSDDRRRLASCPPGMGFRASRHAGGWWAVAYAVPFALISSLYGRAFAPGTAFAGNFYCCDETLHPHFGCWSPITAPAPDFHRPECFGRRAFGK